MATVEGGSASLDNGAMSQEAQAVLTSLVASLSEGVAAGATVTETVAEDGSKTITQVRETEVAGQAVSSSSVVIQPSTAEGSTTGATASLSSTPGESSLTATIPAGVVLAASGPDTAVDTAVAAEIATQSIQDAEVSAVVSAAAASAGARNIVVKTITIAPQELANGQIVITGAGGANAPAGSAQDLSVTVIDTTLLRAAALEVGVANVGVVVLDAADAEVSSGTLTADESAYGGAIRVTEGSSEIIGTSQADLLYGGTTGSDRLMTGSGDDVSYAGTGGNTYLAGGAGADHLVGALTSAGGNTIDGGLGNDVLVAGGAKTAATVTFLEANADIVSAIEDQRQFAGLRDLVEAEVSEISADVGDTFVFGASSGYDYVFNFHAGVDAIQIAANVNGTGIATAADVLARATAVGSDTLIDLGGGNAIHLSGVTLDSLSADDFVIG
mgnify:CR=1 FL=1